jgi:hypothetical protein
MKMVMELRVCETCKHASEIPLELREQFKDILTLFPKKYYCTLENAVKVYNPENPTTVFDCEKHEPK